MVAIRKSSQSKIPSNKKAFLALFLELVDVITDVTVQRRVRGSTYGLHLIRQILG